MDLQLFAGRSHTAGKILKTILILILVIILLAVGIIAYVRLREGRRIVRSAEEAKSCDVIIVLGCGVYPDGSLSPMLRYRLETVNALWQDGVGDVIYITGDHREGEYDEVDHMAEYLEACGIAREDMILDYDGYSTLESMEHASRDIFGRKVLVVTQKYHLYRAMYIGEKLGLDVSGAAAKDWGFSSGTVYRHLRELAATLKDFYVCSVRK